MTGSPIPFKASAITPNLGGAPDTTDDMRGGMGVQGIANITKFVEQGGLFITITGNASIPIDYGMVEGVTIQGSGALRAQGSVVNAVFADRRSPIAYGYGENLAVYFNQSPLFNVAAGGGGRGGRGGGGGAAEAPAAAAGGGRGGRGGGGGGGRGGAGAAACGARPRLAGGKSLVKRDRIARPVAGLRPIPIFRRVVHCSRYRVH